MHRYRLNCVEWKLWGERSIVVAGGGTLVWCVKNQVAGYGQHCPHHLCMTSISETNTILTTDYVKSSNCLKTENESRVLEKFRTIEHEHCGDKENYFLIGRIPETPE